MTIAGKMATFKIIVCLHLVTSLRVHAMDMEKSKNGDSPLDSGYYRHRPSFMRHGAHTGRRQKNQTETLGDRAEFEDPGSKQMKSAEKGVIVPLILKNNSWSEVALPPPTLSKDSGAPKSMTSGKTSSTDSDLEPFDPLDDSPRRRLSLDVTNAPAVTHGPSLGRQQTRGRARTFSATPTQPPRSYSPLPSEHLPRVGAIREWDPLWEKDRLSSSTLRPRSPGRGSEFGQKSGDGTAPFEEPQNPVKKPKQKFPSHKGGKTVNDTVTDSHSPPQKERTSNVPQKTTKTPKTALRPDEGRANKPVEVIAQPVFPKPTKSPKKHTEKPVMKTKPTDAPRRSTTPLLQGTTRMLEDPVISKGESKPQEIGPEEKSEKEVVVPHGGGGKDKNHVGPDDGHHKDTKPIIVISPTEKEPKWTKYPPLTPLVAKVTTTSRPFTPEFYVTVKLTMSWREFCLRRAEFKGLVVTLFEESSKAFVISVDQVVVMYEDEHCGLRQRYVRRIEIVVDLFIRDKPGEYSKTLTEMCFKAFKDGMEILRKSFDYKILEFNLSGSKESPYSTTRRSGPALGTGIIVAIVIAAIAGFCLLVLLLLQLIYRRRSKGKTMRPYVGEAYLGHTANNSLDSIAMTARHLASPNRYSAAGFMNPGLELNANMDKQYPIYHPSNVVVFPGLPSFNLDMEAIEAEFGQLPNNMPRLSEVPAGAEHKNRYANVIPIPETRVHLRQKGEDKATEYINANYVKGHRDRPKAYIATQAPVRNTIEDFWGMVWEQQTKVIVMATGLDESGMSKCEEYFPRSDGVDNTLMFGDFMVVLKLQDVRQDYILSGLTLKDVERNLCREVVHFWYTGWPCQGVPESALSIIHFLLHVQAYQRKAKAPEIIHCSPGTGRTGTLMAIDISMKAFEDKGAADVLNTVYKLRQDRAGAVQTKEQYAFIYKAINEYALMLSEPTLCPEENGLPSRSSRVGTSHDDMMKKY
ncbi:uncharacterized protein LOC135483772 [Lineus longissimus]|uniref:uncharacterized protein LOC135483772 n=1 Tax=Lineus longissimus TaxID=88925 RepID=UPI002B4CBE4B